MMPVPNSAMVPQSIRAASLQFSVYSRLPQSTGSTNSSDAPSTATMPSLSRPPTVSYTEDSVPATSATRPGMIQKKTVTPNATSVFLSARDSLPIAARSALTHSATPSIRRISGLFSSRRMIARATNMSAQMGSAAALHWAKVMLLTRGLLDQAAPDEVGRAADRRQQAADARAVRQHQHQGGADPEPQRVEVLRHEPLALEHLRDDREQAEGGGQQHRDRRGVGHEGRKQAGDRAEGDDDADRRASPTPGSDRMRNANRLARPYFSIA